VPQVGHWQELLFM